MKPYPVHVLWRDATSSDSWECITEARAFKPHTIKTLGWLIHETEDEITVALSLDISGDSVSQYIVIPKSWLIQKRRLRVKLD